MNESDFVNELRELRPTAPSRSLEDRIAAELHAQPAPDAPARWPHAPAAAVIARPAGSGSWGRILGGLGWASAGAAAAVAAITLFHSPAKDRPAQNPGIATAIAEDFQPAESERELVGATDEGVRYIGEGDEPVRQVRYSYRERYTWENAATGAQVEVEVPREDVLLMPVAMQ